MAVSAGKINAEVRLLLSDLKKDVLKVETNLNKIATKSEKTTKKMGVNFKALGGVMAGVFAAKKIFDFGRKYIDLADKQIQAEKRLETVLKSTGNQVGLTADQIKSYASELQKATTFGDEAIIGAQNLLLTFTKIGGDIFPQVTETVLNMSSAFDQGLKESAIQLGKALNDPIQGVTALRRVGVQLTDAQEEQIKKFTELGQIQKAQKIILGELETQVGGAARAATAGAGSIKQFQNALGDLGEETGKKLLKPLNKLLGFLTDLITEEDSLEVTTKELVKVSKEYAKITKTLAEESANLTKEEREKLNVRQATLKLKSVKFIADLNKGYEEQIETISGLASSNIWLKDTMSAAASEIDSINKGELERYHGSIDNLEVLTKAFGDAQLELAQKELKLKTAQGQLNESLSTIQEALKQGVLTQRDLITLSPALVKASFDFKKAKDNETNSIEDNTDAAKEHHVVVKEQTKEEIQLIKELEDALNAAAQKRQDNFQTTLDSIQALSDALFSATDLIQEEQIDKTNEFTDKLREIDEAEAARKKKLLEKELRGALDAQDSVLAGEKKSQLEKIRLKEQEAARNKEIEKEEIRVKRDAAVKQKEADIAQAIINAGVSITKTAANLGFPAALPFMLASGIATKIQIEKIKNQPLPAFAFGGVVPGQKSQGTDSVSAKVTPGEMILNDSQQANLFDQINNGGSGQIVINIITETGDQLDRIVQERTTNGEMNVHVNGLIGVVT